MRAIFAHIGDWLQFAQFANWLPVLQIGDWLQFAQFANWLPVLQIGDWLQFAQFANWLPVPDLPLDTLPMLLAMGVAGMLHCAGMCGGLAVLAARGWRRGLLYNAGRASAYVFLGAMAGALGQAVLRAAPLGAGARALAVAGGLLLLAAGLESLGLVRLPGLAVPARFAGAIAGLVRGGPAGSLVAGFANGLLPCPMVYAFVAMAAAAGSAIGGAATLLVLASISTVPLTFCSLLAGRFPAARYAAGLLMIAMAALTVYRGLSLSGPLCHHLH